MERRTKPPLLVRAVEWPQIFHHSRRHLLSRDSLLLAPYQVNRKSARALERDHLSTAGEWSEDHYFCTRDRLGLVELGLALDKEGAATELGLGSRIAASGHVAVGILSIAVEEDRIAVRAPPGFLEAEVEREGDE